MEGRTSAVVLAFLLVCSPNVLGSRVQSKEDFSRADSPSDSIYVRGPNKVLDKQWYTESAAAEPRDFKVLENFVKFRLGQENDQVSGLELQTAAFIKSKMLGQSRLQYVLGVAELNENEGEYTCFAKMIIAKVAGKEEEVTCSIHGPVVSCSEAPPILTKAMCKVMLPKKDEDWFSLYNHQIQSLRYTKDQVVTEEEQCRARTQLENGCVAGDGFFDVNKPGSSAWSPDDAAATLGDAVVSVQQCTDASVDADLKKRLSRLDKAAKKSPPNPMAVSMAYNMFHKKASAWYKKNGGKDKVDHVGIDGLAVTFDMLKACIRGESK